MRYAEQIRDMYEKNKDRIAKRREESGFHGTLTLQHRFDDTYVFYQKLCYQVGVVPKKKGAFLRTEVI